MKCVKLILSSFTFSVFFQYFFFQSWNQKMSNPFSNEKTYKNPQKNVTASWIQQPKHAVPPDLWDAQWSRPPLPTILKITIV